MYIYKIYTLNQKYIYILEFFFKNNVYYIRVVSSSNLINPRQAHR